MPRLLRTLALALSLVAAALVTAAPASAGPREDRLAERLAEVWQIGVSIPAEDNPLLTGGACFELDDGVLAPFASPDATPSCTVTTGMRIFVIGWSSECSTVEAAPYYGADEEELAACAIAADTGTSGAGGITSSITVDGRPVPLTEVVTDVFTMQLPEGNILGTDEDSALSVAHGWVALLPPLPPGTHEIVITNTGLYFEGTEYEVPFDFVNTTTITVVPGRA